MKANEAPEKIYVHRTVHLGLLAASEMNITGNDIEYTRTDAFIEKACEWIKDNGSHYIDIVNGQLVLTKGIIKNFKKYMKGE